MLPPPPARRLNINASTTIGNYVDDFLEQGRAAGGPFGRDAAGTIAGAVWLNPAYGGFLGVDLEAPRVRAVLIDFAGEVVAQKEVGLRARLAPEAVLEIVVYVARRTAGMGGIARLFAVGPAVPGRPDPCRPGTHRVVRPAARLPGCPAARPPPAAALRLPDLHGGEYPAA